MNTGWMVIGGGIVVVVLMLAGSWLRRYQAVDLGNVSHQWIAEQRFGRAHDPQS